MWWTEADQLFAKYYNALKYSGVADLVANLPSSEETHSPLHDVENSSTHYENSKYRAAVGYLLQAIRKIYNYMPGGGMTFVDRGDNNTWDFMLENLTINDEYHDLDLSAIVPAGAVAVVIRVFLLGTAGQRIAFRKKGNVQEYNSSISRLQSAGIEFENEVLVFLDSNRIIEYVGHSAEGFTNINFSVRGWFL